MTKLGTITKLVRGGIGPDELAAICEMAGMAVDFSDVPRPESAAAFSEAWAQLTVPGAKLVSISGRMENGDTMAALIVMAPLKKTS